ncbi:hypothetical protein MPH_11495, partial [Macrophomina phaseolina MS6]
TFYSSVSTALRNSASIRCVRVSLYVLGLGKRVSRYRRISYLVDNAITNNIL